VEVNHAKNIQVDMINNITKMRRTNQKVREYYKTKGINKIFIKEHSRWNKDIFGVFDGFFIHPHYGVFFIQIKTNQFGPINKIERFVTENKVNAEIIMFKDREKKPYLKTFIYNQPSAG
jgi:hypothetical protein